MSLNGRVDRLLIVAGEASGDLHGARLLSELTALRPTVEAFGLGGDELAEAGLDSIGHSREIAVVGITEVLRVLGRARELFHQLLDAVDRRRPAAAVLIDSPEFNLRLARQLSARQIPVVYYVSPQIWAWRKGRVRSIARDVDRMLVLFPFERAFYAGHDIDVVHVGHPLVDEIEPRPQAWDSDPEPECLRLALLPGSRPSEVERLLPLQLAAARRLTALRPIDVSVIVAPTISPERLRGPVESSGLDLRMVTEDRHEAIAASHLAICASGTATLEVGLLGTPMVVVYRVGLGTALLGRLLIDLPHFSLVNLVCENDVVPELMQADAEPARIAAEAARLLDDPEAIRTMRRGLAELRGRLGESGASRRAAREVDRVLSRGAA